jgi:iron complex transport system permease protein
VGSIFSALLSLTKYVADPHQKLPAIVFWLMGSLATVSKGDALTVCPPIGLAMTALLLVRWRINLLSMGDTEARALGVNTEMLKAILIIGGTVISASAVSVCGIIGWVGLVIPHLGRMLVGPDHKVLLPASLLLGAAYLTLIDDLARSLMSAEIPLGILTSIVGAPFFAIMLRRTRGGWK